MHISPYISETSASSSTVDKGIWHLQLYDLMLSSSCWTKQYSELLQDYTLPKQRPAQKLRFVYLIFKGENKM